MGDTSGEGLPHCSVCGRLLCQRPQFVQAVPEDPSRAGTRVYCPVEGEGHDAWIEPFRTSWPPGHA